MSELARWIEVRLLVPEGWCELAADALVIGPCTTIAFGRPSLATEAAPEGFDYVRTSYPRRLDSPTLRAEIESSVRALALAADAPELAALRVEFRELPAEDYASSWKKSWKPFRAGRLCVVPPDGGQVLRPSDLRLALEPGGAFGTGRHATTRMCLRALQGRVDAGARVLDAGSGSGILSVAAALLGARSVLGFDLDPHAQPYAEELAAQNGVSERCDFVTAGFEILEGRANEFDGTLANIYSDVIREHARTIHRALAPGGWFAFSGCTAQHAVATAESIADAGFELQSTLVRGRWHTFVGVKRR